MQTSSRSRGFTLIEISVVIVIIMVLSALILPNVVRMSQANQKRVFFSSLWQLAGKAHELAIMDKKTAALRLDSSGKTFKVVEIDDQAQNQQTVQNPQQSSDNETEKESLDVPDGIDTGNFTSDGNSQDSGDWEIKFFPDGTSDGGGLEVTDNGRVRSLVIRRDGSLTLVEGDLPDLKEDKWPAGEIEKRGSA